MVTLIDITSPMLSPFSSMSADLAAIVSLGSFILGDIIFLAIEVPLVHKIQDCVGRNGMYKAETLRYRVHRECPITGCNLKDRHLRNRHGQYPCN